MRVEVKNSNTSAVLSIISNESSALPLRIWVSCMLAVLPKFQGTKRQALNVVLKSCCSVVCLSLSHMQCCLFIFVRSDLKYTVE